MLFSNFGCRRATLISGKQNIGRGPARLSHRCTSADQKKRNKCNAMPPHAIEIPKKPRAKSWRASARPCWPAKPCRNPNEIYETKPIRPFVFNKSANAEANGPVDGPAPPPSTQHPTPITHHPLQWTFILTLAPTSHDPTHRGRQTLRPQNHCSKTSTGWSRPTSAPASWAPTAPANPRCSKSWPAWSRSTPAPSSP